jgi:PHD/YefM family antitoxin component YafN of YafNO toxin-antitoxin module
MRHITDDQISRVVAAVIEDQPARPVKICRGRKQAVIISGEAWSSMQETLYILSKPAYVRAIRASERNSKARKVDWRRLLHG